MPPRSWWHGPNTSANTGPVAHGPAPCLRIHLAQHRPAGAGWRSRPGAPRLLCPWPVVAGPRRHRPASSTCLRPRVGDTDDVGGRLRLQPPVRCRPPRPEPVEGRAAGPSHPGGHTVPGLPWARRRRPYPSPGERRSVFRGGIALYVAGTHGGGLLPDVLRAAVRHPGRPRRTPWRRHGPAAGHVCRARRAKRRAGPAPRPGIG